MDNVKIGSIIKKMRIEKNLTQAGLADVLGVSDKTISKWECGQGCPDLAMFPALSALFSVDIASLMEGEVTSSAPDVGNMKKVRFFVCPECGAVSVVSGESRISCCGKPLSPLDAVKATETTALDVENVENEWYVSSSHPMLKDDYISFVAIARGDTVVLRRCYPEWELSVRFQRGGLSTLYHYSKNGGLVYQYIR